ncbi:MAG: cardiolipin synthase [Planctomycetota bacterium]
MSFWITLVLSSLHALLLIAVTIRVLWRDDMTPPARLAWFIVVTVLPYFGVVIYVLFGEARLQSTFLRRHSEVWEEIKTSAGPFLTCPVAAQRELNPLYEPPFRFAASVTPFGLTVGNRTQLLKDGDTVRARMIEDIDNAKEHVHVLYYIWLGDQTGTETAKALIRAAKRGVTCRAMADSLGSSAFIRSETWQQMKEAGVDVVPMLPIGNLIRTLLFSRLDLRNHRKITVVDGRITYCGSNNCADEAFAVKARYAPWVDIMVRVEGPVAAQNLVLFASDWMLHREEAKFSDFELIKEPHPEGIPAQVYASGPTEATGSTPQLFASLMGQARRELVVTTPYFVPDPTVLDAVMAAARRGVEVTLVFPKKNDSWIVAAVSHSYYRRLLDAGIHIYEFRDGLLHAKTLTVDGCVTMMGSSNMDLRSFDLNYENDMLFEDEALTCAIRSRQEAYIRRSDPVTMNDVRRWSRLARIRNNVIATAGPIL